MSVIAKLVVRAVRNFGTGCLVEMSCLSENDLMAAYAESEGDKLFTKYSPWGELRLHQPQGHCLGKADDAFYVMILGVDEMTREPPAFPGAWASARARCVSLTDFGDNAAKTVEFCDAYKKDHHNGVDHFNWKMAVDNPGATNQFKPDQNEAGYWIAFYPANLGRDGAIAAAHA